MPEQPRQKSIEHYGLGQSGYTAGRIERDRALGIEGRNVSYPKGTDEHAIEMADDERFSGAGGRPWAPEASEASHGSKEGAS